jgi:hypothetical protein
VPGAGGAAATAGRVHSTTAKPRRPALDQRLSGRRSAAGNGRTADTVFKGHLPDGTLLLSLRYRSKKILREEYSGISLNRYRSSTSFKYNPVSPRPRRKRVPQVF